MTRLAGKTILVVDDEVDLRGAIAFELEMEGAQVLQASGGHEALELVKMKSPNLVISDVRMPHGDGVELLDNIKKLNPWMPTVLLITGFADLTPDQAYAKGVAGFISKPFDPDTFLKLVLRSIQSPHSAWREKRLEVNGDLEVSI